MIMLLPVATPTVKRRRCVRATRRWGREEMEATTACPRCQGDLLDGAHNVDLTERELLLVRLCLQVVDQHHARGGSLHSDIVRLQDKLSRESGKVGGSGNVEN